MACFYSDQKDYAKAALVYSQVIKTQKQVVAQDGSIKNLKQLVTAQGMLVDVYCLQEDYANAAFACIDVIGTQKHVVAQDNSVEHLRHLALCRKKLGDYYKARRELGNAESAYLSSLNTLSDISGQDEIIKSLCYFADIYKVLNAAVLPKSFAWRFTVFAGNVFKAGSILFSEGGLSTRVPSNFDAFDFLCKEIWEQRGWSDIQKYLPVFRQFMKVVIDVYDHESMPQEEEFIIQLKQPGEIDIFKARYEELQIGVDSLQSLVEENASLPVAMALKLRNIGCDVANLTAKNAALKTRLKQLEQPTGLGARPKSQLAITNFFPLREGGARSEGDAGKRKRAADETDTPLKAGARPAF